MQCTKHNTKKFMVLFNHLEYGMENCPVCQIEEENKKLKYEIEKAKYQKDYYKQLIEENGLDLTECKGCGREITEQQAFIANNGFLFCTDTCATEYEKVMKRQSILNQI